VASSSPSVAVVGATGYTGREIVDLLLTHPDFRIDCLTSRTFVGESYASVYPEFAGRLEHVCESLDPARLNEHDLVFLSLPHGRSMEIVPHLDLQETRVVDLAADYRFADPAAFERAYDTDHADPGGLERAVYGLTEFFADEVAQARLVANPGCYATACLVPLLALLEEGWVEPPVHIDAKSGISGAGRTPSEANTFVRCNEDIRPYRVARHRHEPEMTQFLSDDAPLTFVPHVIPLDRGIEAALYVRCDDGEAAVERLRSLAGEHPFFRHRSRPAGVKAVARTPYLDLCAVPDGSSLVVFSVLDNLQKGAASQAVQNANLQFGYPVQRGLLGS